MSSRLFVALGVVTALLLNACNGDEDEADFDYGRDEMKAAIEGTWEGTTQESSTAASVTPVTLRLVYGAPDTRPLCGNRVLANGEAQLVGPRCADMSSMNVTGTWSPTSAPAGDLAVRGTFAVYSLRFDGHGELHADLADQKKLMARLSDGTLEGSLQGADGAVIAGFTLRRK